ncbi:hypothetical protein NDU88_005372 [Pleurodeles waltl]|uniref:Uncharacterized protein n=1 Tax=Pleurodeles waltl TaxID=8319 RepID=A0AAV7MAA8_PLEWA|nr:hypothetical protein NDU88_005372 [Pleurodeles waltl]
MWPPQPVSPSEQGKHGPGPQSSREDWDPVTDWVAYFGPAGDGDRARRPVDASVRWRAGGTGISASPSVNPAAFGVPGQEWHGPWPLRQQRGGEDRDPAVAQGLHERGRGSPRGPRGFSMKEESGSGTCEVENGTGSDCGGRWAVRREPAGPAAPVEERQRGSSSSGLEDNA